MAAPKPVKPGSAPVPAGPTPATATSPGRQDARPWQVSRGVVRTVHKVVFYGPGGVGKTELASLIESVGVPAVFIDLEEGSHDLDVARVSPTPATFEELLDAVVQAKDMAGVGAIIVDSLTKAEELCIDFTLRTVPAKNRPDDAGRAVESIEGYGWGKGYIHVYEQFLKLLQALDAVARAGKHILCTCHDCTANVPNPGGDDWIRYEPRLQSPSSGKGSIRHRVKEWCDHLLYVGFDAFVKGGKATGSGTRTIYPVEMPTHWAKSRTLSEPSAYERGSAALWQQLGVEGTHSR